MATQTQRHIIQTVYDRTGLSQFKQDMLKAQKVSGAFGTKIAKDAQFAGIGIKKSFDKAGNVIIKKTATFVKGGKQMKVAWQESAKGAQALGVSVTKTGGAMGKFNAVIGKAISRALVVAPVWLALRSAMMLVIRTIRDMIKAYVDLDEGLARIRTVMHGTTEDINAEMTSMKRQILDMAVDSRVSIKELAEVMYFLKTASLTAEQAMSAFEHTVDAMTGTGVGAKEMARAVAGVFNTMGKYITDATTDAEKFQKIADVLTYTFTRQDVEMGELIAGYTKLAPFLSGLEDSFTDIVTILGFLNTRMLRAGRTGRLTGRAILQITKNASKLASIFGIAFDPDKPINLLKTIEAINKAMKDTEKITFEQSEALRKVFATRGAVAIKLLITVVDELKEEIKLAGIEAEGFAEKIAEIKMGTIPAQAQRMKNIFAVLFEEFVSGYYGAGNLADALTLVNDSFESMREDIQTTGEWLGWVTQQGSKFIIMLEQINKVQQRGGLLSQYLPTGASALLNAKELYQIFKDMGLLKFQSFEEYKETQQKITEEAKKEEKVREKIKDLEEETNKVEINRLAVEKETTRHQIALLKVRGASALDIAKYNLRTLESIRDMITEEEYNLELLKRQNKVIQEQALYRKQLIDKLEKTGATILKITGASELKILNILEQQLKARQSQYQPIAYANELLDIQLRKEIAIQNVIKQTSDLQLSAMERYIKATEEERRTMKKVYDLMRFSPEVLKIEIQKASKPVQDMFMTMKNVFDPKQYRAGIEGIMRDLGLFFEEIALKQDITRRFGAKMGIERTEPFTGTPYKTRIPITEVPSIENLQLRTDIGNINISIRQELKKGEIKEEIVTRTVEDIAEAIRRDPNIRKAINEKIEEF